MSQDSCQKLWEAFSSDSELAADKLRIKYLGKNGLFKDLAASLRLSPVEERKSFGQALNQLKDKLEAAISDKEAQSDKQQTKELDLSMPPLPSSVGHLHPISQAIEEISRIFTQIGFNRVRYPEVDWDYYAFEALNMPKSHPARDEWETFFVEQASDLENLSKKSHSAANLQLSEKKHVFSPQVGSTTIVENNKLFSSNPQSFATKRTSWTDSKLGKVVLTPHTSNGQVREMERLKSKPPIRMIDIARTYRRQSDTTHTQMFHQFEGLVIDKGINIQHLKGTLDYFAESFYGPGTKSRIRPFHFQFTEPSFEVDFSCHICGGTGKRNKTGDEACKFCKSGWHEVGGAGMVHPNVLKAGGIDPDEYTGFAFGWGVERTYTLKKGLNIDDIRLFYSGNLEFLQQF